MTQDFRAVANMSADEYKKLLEGAAGGVIHAAENADATEIRLAPESAALPGTAESSKLGRSGSFHQPIPALMLNENNGVTIVQFLKANKATASLATWKLPMPSCSRTAVHRRYRSSRTAPDASRWRLPRQDNPQATIKRPVCIDRRAQGSNPQDSDVCC